MTRAKASTEHNMSHEHPREPLGPCRHKDGCTAWMWCAEESGCTDDTGSEIPFRGCQLKNEPMQAWGLPSVSLVDSMKVANSYSGYIKREHSAD